MANIQYVNTYLIDRAYGGPEEGGWYYQIGKAQSSIPVSTEAAADATLARRAKHCDRANRGRRSINSVLSEGRYAAWIEDHPAADFPIVRPHYE